ncbi:hypothetical protein DY000_02007807 [Brassica cretica]|uniref:Uncharacterized protein n=1 Tax=Brassica cretica TaxID=69181 RepID=A0ABQ7BUN0_BRACR|nr:hypothetical protein DY000_02007807 [Brassica cretica]
MGLLLYFPSRDTRYAFGRDGESFRELHCKQEEECYKGSFELAFQCHGSEVNQHLVSEVMHILLKTGQSTPSNSSNGGVGPTKPSNSLILSPNSCLIDIIPGLEQVKEQRREIQEVRCRFEGYDAEQPSRTTRRLFPKRTSV